MASDTNSSTGSADPTSSDLTSNKQVEMDEAYSAFATEYDDFHRGSLLLTLAKKECMRLISPKPGAKFLDMAAGTGDATEQFFEYQDGVNHDTDSTATLVDLNSDMLAIAKKRLSDTKWAKDGRIEFIEGNADHIPGMPEDTFDTYCCYLGMHNMPNHDKVLREAMRVLKPGGKIYIFEVDTGTWYIGRLFRSLLFHFRHYILMMRVKNWAMASRIINSGREFPSPPDFVQEMKDAGFAIEDTGYHSMYYGIFALFIGTKPTK
ncbi:S-adenosyl-L-methionine-dependent methyltransferase [Linderina pennispora]|uniref:S-adenosyl-L-methionine-dependent methyltransferase n=1 Tax=Linderina pennispora TaxID=61395 RepID=A0A1Y1VYS0_9FUNG|nr:S-adenosyl-L-methionine-dependent methyltransferase [Linderina pennispora]ORX66409.1 S-adenosyl-L-methionine-dependent methyltransferase [Linderina pennispora]